MIRQYITHFLGRDTAPDDVFSRLKQYKGYSGRLIGLGLFSAILFIKLDVASYAGLSDVGIADVITMKIIEKMPVVGSGLLRIFQDRWSDILFYSFVWIWYWQYDSSATKEIEILGTLYSDDRAPSDWDKVTGGRLVPFLSIGITASFIFILLVSDNLQLLSAAVLLLLCQDAIGNSMLRRNILEHFYNPLLQPDVADPLREVILERRKVALEYWVWRPHLARIGLMMAATALLSTASTLREVGGYALDDSLFRLVFALMILCNEFTIAGWRIARDNGFVAINQKLLAVRSKLTGA